MSGQPLSAQGLHDTWFDIPGLPGHLMPTVAALKADLQIPVAFHPREGRLYCIPHPFRSRFKPLAWIDVYDEKTTEEPRKRLLESEWSRASGPMFRNLRTLMSDTDTFKTHPSRAQQRIERTGIYAHLYQTLKTFGVADALGLSREGCDEVFKPYFAHHRRIRIQEQIGAGAFRHAHRWSGASRPLFITDRGLALRTLASLWGVPFLDFEHIPRTPPLITGIGHPVDTALGRSLDRIGRHPFAIRQWLARPLEVVVPRREAAHTFQLTEIVRPDALALKRYWLRQQDRLQGRLPTNTGLLYDLLEDAAIPVDVRSAIETVITKHPGMRDSIPAGVNPQDLQATAIIALCLRETAPPPAYKHLHLACPQSAVDAHYQDEVHQIHRLMLAAEELLPEQPEIIEEWVLPDAPRAEKKEPTLPPPPPLLSIAESFVL